MRDEAAETRGAGPCRDLQAMATGSRGLFSSWEEYGQLSGSPEPSAPSGSSHEPFAATLD